MAKPIKASRVRRLFKNGYNPYQIAKRIKRSYMGIRLLLQREGLLK